MADSKISALTAIAASDIVTASDVIPIVDVSASSTMKVTKYNFLGLTDSTTQFLRGDGTFTTPAGSGDVTGPASAVANNLVTMSGTTGKIIRDSGVAITGYSASDHTHTGTYQPADAQLDDVAGLTATDNAFIVGNGLNFTAEGSVTARTSLGLGTMALQASTTYSASDHNHTGVYQAADAQLDDIAGLTATDNAFIVGNGTNFTAEGSATARTSLGLGSIATQNASNVSITGGSVAGITDLDIADGGTGASSAATAFGNLKQDATTTATGVAELATTAETTTGTDTGRVVTPDGLSGSIYGRKTLIIKGLAETTAVASGDGQTYMTVPVDLNGMDLVDADIAVYGAPTASGFLGQIHNLTNSSDILSTRISLDASEYNSYTAVTAPVINTSADGVVTGDKIRFDIDGAAAASGCDWILTFQTP